MTRTTEPGPVTSAVLLLTLGVVCGFPGFRDSIPNGKAVVHPCYPLTIWNGVGHQLVAGTGPNNPFGLDWKANKYVWNETLCALDSDLDGVSNGEELGDPDCVFEKGATPARTTGITHPGVCEPPMSTHCLRVNGLWMNITGCGAAPDFRSSPVLTTVLSLTTLTVVSLSPFAIAENH